MNYLETYFADRKAKIARGEEILAAAERANRDLTPLERSEYDGITRDVADLDARIESVALQEQRAREADEGRRGYEHVIPGEDRSGSSKGYGRRFKGSGDEELDEFLFGSARSIDVDFSDVQRYVDERSGRFMSRAMQSNTGTGVNVVPTSFRQTLYEYLAEEQQLRRTNVLVLATASGEQMLLPKGQDPTGLGIVQQGSVLPDAQPTFSQGTLDSYKYGALTQVATELISDSGLRGPDLLAYLAKSFARALAAATGADLVVGNGSGKPHGIVHALGGTVHQVQGGTGVSGAPTADDLIDLFYAVPEPYRSRGFWLASTSAIKAVRKAKSVDNDYIWAAGLGDAPETILGRPVLTDPNMPAAATDGTSIVFGDFSAFAVRDVGPIRWERSDDFAFDHDVTTFRAVQRIDSELLDETALGTFKGGTA
jgi:HK97 family phage major capsid protein